MTIEDIIKAVTEEFGVSRELLLSRDRHRFVSETRQIAFWFAYRYLSMPALRIGKHFGRGHLTVFHGIEVVTARIKNERGFYEHIKAVKQRLKIVE